MTNDLKKGLTDEDLDGIVDGTWVFRSDVKTEDLLVEIAKELKEWRKFGPYLYCHGFFKGGEGEQDITKSEHIITFSDEDGEEIK